MTNDVEIDIQLWDTTLQPKAISKLVGISPDVDLLRGERNKSLDLPRGNLWAIRSKVTSDLVSDHWLYLEQAFGDKKEVLIDIAKTGTAKIVLIINSSIRVPSIQIPPSLSRFAGSMNAVIDIDHLQS